MSSLAPRRIYEVRAEGVDGRVRGFGARGTAEEGAALLEEQVRRYEGASGWRRWWLEEIDATGLWQPPPAPTPREQYTTRVTDLTSPGRWTSVHVEVLDGERMVAEYDRNYAVLKTFEPFRQGDRDLALISRNYTATAVVDLGTGEVIAEEEHAPGGFCPVGFYVPDWWDLHDGTQLFAGSLSWRRLHPALLVGGKTPS